MAAGACSRAKISRAVSAVGGMTARRLSPFCSAVCTCWRAASSPGKYRWRSWPVWRRRRCWLTKSTPPASPAKNRAPHNYNTSSDRSWRSEGQHTARDSEESGIGHEEDQEETQLLLEILSNIHTPRVPEVLARSALLVWSPPVRENEPELEVVEPIPDSDLEYEVLLSDKGKDGKYRSIFSGASLECRLTDLRPHTEYHIRVHAVLKSHKLRGGASDTVSFLTKACEPDQPNPPKMLQRSKTTINLRWNPPVDNGAFHQSRTRRALRSGLLRASAPLCGGSERRDTPV